MYVPFHDFHRLEAGYCVVEVGVVAVVFGWLGGRVVGWWAVVTSSRGRASSCDKCVRDMSKMLPL